VKSTEENKLKPTL